MCILGERLCLGQVLANTFCKETDSKYFRFADHMFSVTTTQFFLCSRQAATDNTEMNGHGHVPVELCLRQAVCRFGVWAILGQPLCWTLFKH